MPRHTATDEKRRPTEQPTMRDVAHTNPTTGEPFGDSQVFRRGRVAVVDGGSAESEADEQEDRDGEPMGDIDHTPREGAPDANDVYARGAETEENVEDDV